MIISQIKKVNFENRKVKVCEKEIKFVLQKLIAQTKTLIRYQNKCTHLNTQFISQKKLTRE